MFVFLRHCIKEYDNQLNDHKIYQNNALIVITVENVLVGFFCFCIKKKKKKNVYCFLLTFMSNYNIVKIIFEMYFVFSFSHSG